MTTLLIHPPVVKPCEPPAGIAKLTGALWRHGEQCSVWDANLEGLLGLMQAPLAASDRWSRRAFRNRARHLADLREPAIYGHPDRYRRAVADINRVVEMAASGNSTRLSLTNYQDSELSPVKSCDLIRASQKPEQNPFYPFFSRRLTQLVEGDEPGVVGFSLNFLSQALCAFAMIGFIRRQWPGLTLILGGGLITSWMRKPDWRNPFADLVDHLVAGPGESALLSLLGMPETQISLQQHQRPDYHLFTLSDYLAPGPILPYSASTGCYWNRCAFCPEKVEGNPYVAVPPVQVIEDLRALANQTHPVLIHLLDNAVSPALIKVLVEQPPGAPWYGFARIHQQLGDLDFCMALKQSGCVMLKLGLESGDQSMLDREQKGIDLNLASRALRNLKEAGISTYVYLLFGTLSETLTEARRTLEFTAGHSDAIDFLNLAIFNLPINSPQARQLETKMISEGDLSLYTEFCHPKGWHRGRVRQFLDKEFKRHPAVGRILRRDPLLFTSNHAPFFTSALRSISRDNDAIGISTGGW
jgi:Radical SAM superfamily